MAKSIFGSVGAARMLAAAERVGRWMIRWERDDICLCCEWKRRRGTGKKGIKWWEPGIERTRSEARLLLRGLLAESTARELVEWVGRRFPVPFGAGDERPEVLRYEMLAKMRELGMVP